MSRRRAVVRLGVPALIVAGLAAAALWRVGPPPESAESVGTAGTGAVETITQPLTKVADVLANNSIGRQASLEHIRIRERAGDRYLWIDSGDEHPVFVVLDPDVKRDGPIELTPGRRVTMIGIVRPAPKAAEAVRQWHIPPETARLVETSGTYLHVTEMRR
jgi:hypothetical protein